MTIVCTVVLAACARIEDPWVEGERLAAERARHPATAQALEHRLARIQRDR